jgi:hypothetical protein
VKGAGEPRVAIRPLSGISQEQARDARARAWAFVFQCWQEKQEGGRDLTTLTDTRGDSKHVSRADKAIIPE